MSRPAEAPPSSFPHWVALGSLGLVLWLFFANTVPALHERDALRGLQDELTELRKRYDTAILETRAGQGAANQCDLQSLFVAIDQRGYTPAELCAMFPDAEATPTKAKKP